MGKKLVKWICSLVYPALNGPKIVKDGAVQNILFKIDMSNWEILAQSEPLGLDHANSITYNSRLNQLIVSHCYNGTDHDISFVDPETLRLGYFAGSS